MSYQGNFEQTLAMVKQHMAEQSGNQDGQAKSQIPDYMQLVATYQRENKCSKFQAMQAVNREHPNSRRAYLQKHNPGMAF